MYEYAGAAVEQMTASGVREVTHHTEVDDAVKRLEMLYGQSIARMLAAIKLVGAGEKPELVDCRGYYPVLGFAVPKGRVQSPKDHLSYGYCRNGPGLYTTSITRPGMFSAYLREQLKLLQMNHGGPVLVGIGAQEIPLDFAIEGSIREIDADVADHFTALDIRQIQDFKFAALPGTFPLSLYGAMRVDYAVTRFPHYSGTAAEHLQNFVLLTNYDMFMDVFRGYAESVVGKDGYTELVEPEALKSGGASIKRPQMPALHLKRADANGISIINIGVGPSNAKTIMDLLAVFRPHVALMVGHCAGLRATQNLGHYILGEGYYRLDGVLDRLVPLTIPLVELTEINHALRQAARAVLGMDKLALKGVLESGIVATVADRHWEIDDAERERINDSRALAVDMESGTVAASGFRHRTPTGTLLRVSDMPTRGKVKLQGAAWQFYKDSVVHHLQIAIRAVEMMREGIPGLHSRKLRAADDAPFR